jgi:hypothetical protein
MIIIDLNISYKKSDKNIGIVFNNILIKIFIINLAIRFIDNIVFKNGNINNNKTKLKVILSLPIVNFFVEI